MWNTKQLDVKYDIKNSNHEHHRVQVQGFKDIFEIKRSVIV